MKEQFIRGTIRLLLILSVWTTASTPVTAFLYYYTGCTEISVGLFLAGWALTTIFAACLVLVFAYILILGDM